MNILTRSTSEFNAIDSAENHGGKSTGAIENIETSKTIHMSSIPYISENELFLIFTGL